MSPSSSTGRDVLEKRAIGRRGRVVEFVHDHDVEVARVERAEARGVEALDRREDVLEPPRPLPAHPQLAEGMVAQAVAERRQALLEDLFSMGHEQQSRPRESVAKPRVVDRSHHRLPGPSGGHEQISVVPALPRQRDLLEQPLLERLWPKLDRARA